MDLKSKLVKRISKTLLKIKDGYRFMVDFLYELIILVKRSPGLFEDVDEGSSLGDTTGRRGQLSVAVITAPFPRWCIPSIRVK